MTWGFLLKNLAATVLLPPMGLLILAAVGWGLWQRHPRLARGLLGAGILGLWLVSTPFIAKTLIGSLESPHRSITGDEADAIVVLGSGVRRGAVEFETTTTVTGRALERLRYGAWLHRRTGKPILVTGGSPAGSLREAPILRLVLEEEFQVPVKWVEDASINTHENARYSAILLQAAGIRRVYLVSQPWHLPRARYEFEREGMTVVSAGTDYSDREWDSIFEYLPAAHAMALTYYGLHEWLGRLWALFNG